MATNHSKKRNYDLSRGSPGAKKADATQPRADLMEALSGFLGEAAHLVMRPADAVGEELARPHGWKSGLLNLVPSVVFASAVVALMVAIGPGLVGPGGEEVPGWMVWVINTVLVAVGYLALGLLTLGTLHLMARLAGGKGEVKGTWHLLTKMLVVFNPLWLVANVLSPVLPGLNAGLARYDAAQFVVDMGFLWVLAQMLPGMYGISKNKAVMVAVAFWVMAMLLWAWANSISPTAAGV
ncbi:Uncharacterised protein [uncultured archaeon]|nr:Uncharacterised protein [uncultured archaeon]